MDTSQHNITSWRRGEVPSHWPDRHSPVVAVPPVAAAVSPPSVVIALDEERFRVVRALHGDAVLGLDPRQRQTLTDPDPMWVTHAREASPRKPSPALEAALRSASAEREPIVDRDAKDRCDASGLIDLNALARMTCEKPPAVPLTPTVKRRRPTKPPIAPSHSSAARASLEARVAQQGHAGPSEAPACERPQIAFDADAPEIVIDETTQSFILETLDEPRFDDRGDTVLERSSSDERQLAQLGTSPREHSFGQDSRLGHESQLGRESHLGRYAEHSFDDEPLVTDHLESEVAHNPMLPLMLDLDGRRAKLGVALADTDRFGRVMAAPGGGDGDDEDEDLPFDLDFDAEDALAIEELGDGGADDVVGSGRLDVDLRASTPVSRADATFVQRATDMFSRTVRRVMVPLLAITLLVLAMGARWSFAGSATTRTYAALHANDGSAGTGSAGSAGLPGSSASSGSAGSARAGSGAGTGSSSQAATGPGTTAISAAVHTFKVGNREMSGKININTASEDELQLLPTVGPSKAERIVTWRKKNGGFKRPADLRRVKGFGYKTYKKLEPFLDIKGDTTLAAVK